MSKQDEWEVTTKSSIQEVLFGAGVFLIRNNDGIYIGDGSEWRPATATEVFEYFVKTELQRKAKAANLTMMDRLKIAVTAVLT